MTDYLVKPIQFDRFLKAVMKAIPDHDISSTTVSNNAVEAESPAFLYFRVDRKMVKVFLNEILYVESLKDYVKIVTINGTLVTKHSMATLEAMLPTVAFLRVHRSYMISIAKIDAFTPEEIDVRKNIIPIGKLYRQQVLKVLAGARAN